MDIFTDMNEPPAVLSEKILLAKDDKHSLNQGYGYGPMCGGGYRGGCGRNEKVR
jgi:hypothetical protein